MTAGKECSDCASYCTADCPFGKQTHITVVCAGFRKRAVAHKCLGCASYLRYSCPFGSRGSVTAGCTSFVPAGAITPSVVADVPTAERKSICQSCSYMGMAKGCMLGHSVSGYSNATGLPLRDCPGGKYHKKKVLTSDATTTTSTPPPAPKPVVKCTPATEITDHGIDRTGIKAAVVPPVTKAPLPGGDGSEHDDLEGYWSRMYGNGWD